MSGDVPSLWYVSGPHGAGKSTLIERAVADGLAIPGVRVRRQVQDPDPLARAQMNLDLYAREHYENVRLAALHANRVVLGDRCVYDVLAYARARSLAGWTNKADEHRLRREVRSQAQEAGVPRQVIFLVPGADTVRQHLALRERTIPWRHEAGPFLDMLVWAYRRLHSVLGRSRSHRVRLVADGTDGLRLISMLSGSGAVRYGLR